MNAEVSAERSIRNTTVCSPRKKRKESKEDRCAFVVGERASERASTRRREYEPYESRSLRSLAGDVHACYYTPGLNRKLPKVKHRLVTRER